MPVGILGLAINIRNRTFNFFIFNLFKKIIQCISAIQFKIKKYRIQNEQTPSANKLFAFVKEIVAAIRLQLAESKYSKENYISEFPLRYDVNCSGLINYALVEQAPNALQEVKEFIQQSEIDNGHLKIDPLCLYYFRFLQNKDPKKHWQVVKKAKQMHPGDLIVFCENTEKVSRSGQHMMLVASEIQFKDNEWALCQVYDSTRYGHGADDQRGLDGRSGVGEGQIALRVDDAGDVSGLKWSYDGTSIYKNFAIARIVCN